MIIVSSLAQILSRSRIGLVRWVTRLAKARVGHFMTRLTRSGTRLVKAKARSLTKNILLVKGSPSSLVN